MSVFLQKKAPIEQDFIWVAEYMDGTYLSEEIGEFHKDNFLKINRKGLLRFGFVGSSMSLYYEVYGGVFKILGRMIELIYTVGDQEYYLTGQQLLYIDPISYKDCEAFFNPKTGGVTKGSITQFNFGYKQWLKINGVEFKVQPIVKIPYQQPAFIEVSLFGKSLKKEVKGKLQFKRNGVIVEEIDAPLKPKAGGKVNWIIQ